MSFFNPNMPPNMPLPGGPPPRLSCPPMSGPNANRASVNGQGRRQLMHFPVWTNPGEEPFQGHYVFQPDMAAYNGPIGPDAAKHGSHNFVPRKVYDYGAYSGLYDGQPNLLPESGTEKRPEDKAGKTQPKKTLYKFDYSRENRGEADNVYQQFADRNGLDGAPAGRKKKKDAKALEYMPIVPTFDWHMVQSAIKPSKETDDFDQQLEEACTRRLHEVAPSLSDTSALANTVSKVTVVLEKLKQPGTCDACRIDAIDAIGPYRMGTLLKGHRVAEFVVTLRTLPVKAALQALGNKMLEELARLETGGTMYHLQLRENYIEVANVFQRDSVEIHFAVIPELFPKLENILVDECTVKLNLRAIAEAQWFEDAARKAPNVASLIRLMKDICRRFGDLAVMSPWMVAILCHYAITETEDGAPVPFGAALKRIFQMIAAGIFLPYSTGIIDPLEDSPTPLHSGLTTTEQEALSATAQTLLRVLTKESGVNYVLGLKPMPIHAADVLERPTEWNGVQVIPSATILMPESPIPEFGNSKRNLEAETANEAYRYTNEY